MRRCAILLLFSVCWSAAETRHPRTVSPDKHRSASVTQLDQLANLQRDRQTMLEQWQLHKNQITELTEKYDVIRTENDELRRHNEAIMAQNDALKKDNDMKQIQLDGLRMRQKNHNERLMRLEVRSDDLGTDNGDEETSGRSAGTNIFQNTTSYSQGSAAGVVVFQARNQGFSGAAGSQIPFELMDINIGDSFDPSGLFTAPVTGIYQMNYEVTADVSCGTNHVCARLHVNGVSIMLSCSEYAAGGGSSFILQLAAEDTVWLALAGTCYVLYETTSEGSSQFGGHLLHEII